MRGEYPLSALLSRRRVVSIWCLAPDINLVVNTKGVEIVAKGEHTQNIYDQTGFTDI